MHLSEILVAELTAFAAKTGDKELDIVETGTIRGDGEQYRVNDGWSTLTFAQWVKCNEGSLHSIDLDTTTAQKVLAAEDLGIYVNLRQGHSIAVLAEMVGRAYSKAKRNNKGEITSHDEGFFDVAFLDSDNCGALIFHEYLVVKQIMRSPGLIMVDDVDITSTGVVKGHEILPYAQKHGIEHRVIERAGDGYSTGVLVFEV